MATELPTHCLVYFPTETETKLLFYSISHIIHNIFFFTWSRESEIQFIKKAPRSGPMNVLIHFKRIPLYYRIRFFKFVNFTYYKSPFNPSDCQGGRIFNFIHDLHFEQHWHPGDTQKIIFCLIVTLEPPLDKRNKFLTPEKT